MADLRRLRAADAAAYRSLRLEALERHPEAFGASADDERCMTDDDVGARLERSVVFGAFDRRALAGVAGWYRLEGDKVAHRGVLWGMYVTPSARGLGLGAALVERVRDDARGTVAQLHLTVVVGNEGARRLYERAGFASYGVEPRALRVGGVDHDELLMVLRLD